jgi:hypothetical protein
MKYWLSLPSASPPPIRLSLFNLPQPIAAMPRAPHLRLFANLRVWRQEEGDADGGEEQPLFSAEWLQEEVSEPLRDRFPAQGLQRLSCSLSRPTSRFLTIILDVCMCVCARAHECIHRSPGAWRRKPFLSRGMYLECEGCVCEASGRSWS